MAKGYEEHSVKILITIFFIGLFSLASAADPICSASKGNSALIVIDMQSYFVTRTGADQDPENRGKVEKILKEQLGAIKKAEKAHIPIVFLEYAGLGETNTILKEAVSKYKDARFFEKTTDGMFELRNKHKEELEKFLQSENVGTLIITGANGGACVQSSIIGALENDCNVVAYNKAIADFNYKDFIYPYEGHYSAIPKQCADCSFKEVSTLGAAANYMVNYSGHAERSSSTSAHGEK